MERIQKLNEMLEATPHDCFLLHALGLEYLKIGEPVKALHAFQKVVDSDEKYVGTYYHLARTYEKLNQQEEAVNTYEKGIEIAKLVNDMHARNELQMALDNLID